MLYFNTDDGEQDPDFNFEESEDAAGTEFDEFKYDRSTKISRKEVDSLINELITAYDLDELEDLNKGEASQLRSLEGKPSKISKVTFFAIFTKNCSS